MEVINVKLSEIRAKTENHRLKDSEEDVSGLMMSIKKTGLINPVSVKKNANGRGYILMAGFRRMNAIKKLGFKTVPVHVMPSNTSPNIINLVENMQRENTSSYEIGRGIYAAMKKDKMTEREVGVLLGMGHQTVRQYLDLYNDTPVAFRSKVRASSTGSASAREPGTINNSAAHAICGLKKSGKIDRAETLKLFKKVAKDPTITAAKIREMGKNVSSKTGKVNMGTAVTNMKILTVTLKMKDSQLKKLGTSPHKKVREALTASLGIKFL